MTFEELIEQPTNLLLRCRSGSHAYGLAAESSDEDFRGVFFLPKEEFYGLQYTPQLSDATNDRTYYEVGRFFELLLKANPTALELLATTGEDRLYVHPVLEVLKIEDFLTKACAATFAGYARSQIRKASGLNKKVHNPVDQTLKTVLEFCYVIQSGKTIAANNWLAKKGIVQSSIGLAAVDHTKGIYAMYLDPSEKWARGIMRSEKAYEVALTPVPKGADFLGYLSFNQDSYSTYRRTYRDYWDWVEKRNDQRYQNTLNHGGGYDAKNMMHTIRLLEMAIGIYHDGTLSVRRPNRDFLLAIKSGNYGLKEVLYMAEERLQTLELAAAKSTLPSSVDPKIAAQHLVTIRESLYRD